MARLLLDPIGAELDTVLGPDEIRTNRASMEALERALAEKVAITHAGWGEKYVARVREKGKLPTWERIDHLRDAGSDVFEVGTLVNWGRKFEGSTQLAPGAGVVTAFVRIGGRWTIVVANDNTVASGAWWPLTPEKIERAQEIALRMRLPVIYLVDCSGLFLPEQSRSFAGATGAGHIFKKNALLAANGVPQIAGVFGDCIAGGGYMPIISDRVVMTESAYMVIAGAALIRGAKSQNLTSLDIGGPEVHVHQSGCADLRVPDDETALATIRAEVAKLPTTGVDFYRYGADPAEPKFPATELAALFPPDPRQGYAIEQVIARLVDGSAFHEVLAHVGREMIVGVGRVSGLLCGFVANRQGLVDEPGRGKRTGSALYREGIAKISTFSRACNDDGIPIVWLQDISGFDIGVEAERQGLLGYGSNLIYTNSTNTAPMFTVLLRKASGAGYYAMAGLPYDPVVQLSTPVTRLSVMEGRTLAIAAFNSKLDDNFEIATKDPAERQKIEEGMATTAARIDADMDPIGSAARMDTDEIVPLGRLRAWLTCLVESAWQSTGYRRTKNPRILGMHDLEVLSPPRGATSDKVFVSDPEESALPCPTVGVWSPRIVEGATIEANTLLGHLRRGNLVHEIRAGDSASGAAIDVLADGTWCERGTRLCDVGLAVTGRSSRAAAASDVPEGTTAVRAESDGTIWLAPSPQAPAFVAVGSVVENRSTLALIEVMKTFTPVRSPLAGTVTNVLVKTGQAVRAGQVLFHLT